MKLIKSMLTLAASLFVAQAFAQSTVESQLIALSKKRAQWLVAGKLDSLATLYDARSITVHNNGMIKSTAEHFDDIKNGRPIYKNIEIKESTVRDFGDTAVLVGKGIFNIAMNGQDMNYNMTFTEVYKKVKDQWKLIARQAVQQN